MTNRNTALLRPITQLPAEMRDDAYLALIGALMCGRTDSDVDLCVASAVKSARTLEAARAEQRHMTDEERDWVTEFNGGRVPKMA
jgi:hypothetical protein